MEAMVNAAGQRRGSLQQEEVLPFPAWLALAFGSDLSLFEAPIPYAANTFSNKHQASGTAQPFRTTENQTSVAAA